MSVTGALAAFALKHTFDLTADTLLNWLGDRFTDHSQILPKALAQANDRAWQAVGLALAGDGLVDKVKDLFRDRDLTAARDAIRKFLAATATGLEMSPVGLRARACDELNKIRRLGRLAPPRDPSSLAADLARFGNTGRMVGEAAEAVGAVADALAKDAPQLAQVLRLAPPGGSPLLVTSFLFFLRREVEANEELSRGLTFDSLRQLTAAQDRGFALLEGRTEGILDQIGLVFDELATLRKEMREWQESNRVAAVAAETPIGVSVSNERELARLRAFRDRMRDLPPEIVESTDWQALGADLDAGGLFAEALAAHQAAATKAKADANRTAEAENEFRAFKDACETGKWAEARESLARAVRLDPQRFQLFDRSRYRLDAILGVGGFGTVFRCLDTVDVDDDGNPLVVAVKSLRGENLDRDPRAVFAEARTLRDLSRPGSRLIRVIGWGYAYADPENPDRRERPYIVMEYFPGETLEAIVNRSGPLTVADFLAVASQIVVAIQEAHSRNVYHRDLKPSNVMARRLADGTWDVRVIDFGLAVRYDLASQASLNQAFGRSTEKDRSLTGSLEFAPPEQRGKLPGVKVGPYSDVYAFGKTCLWLLFQSTEPKSWDWEGLPTEARGALHAMLERCTADRLDRRFAEFGKVAEVLASVDPASRAAAAPGEQVKVQATIEEKAREAGGERACSPIEKTGTRTGGREVVESPPRGQVAGKSGPKPEAQRDQGLPQSQVVRPSKITVGKVLEKPNIAENQQEKTACPLCKHILNLPADWKVATACPCCGLVFIPARGNPSGGSLALAPVEPEPPSIDDNEVTEPTAIDDDAVTDPLDPATPRKPGHPFELELPGGVKMAFAWCPPGKFLMGSDNEEPQRRVTLTRGFYMGVYPVTQAQWKAVTGKTPSQFKGSKLPVEQVSWIDCSEFCKILTKNLSQKITIRLPSEAEWEYACRAGTTTEYHTGDGQDAMEEAGWYDRNSRRKTHPVGEKAANAWGLHDTHGNVWEWCQDWYTANLTEDATDPKGRKSGSTRVLRGGGWGSVLSDCTSVYRRAFEPASRGNNFGCRVCFHLPDLGVGGPPTEQD